jgi:serine/threonine-protein kinase RsbW
LSPLVGQGRVFALRCIAEAERGRVVRAGIEQWLTGLGWPEDDREDIVLAVSEAFENAAAHSYPPGIAGVVDIFGGMHVTAPTRRVVLRVRDRGHWRPAPSDPGYRGHGLRVMREVMDELHVVHTPAGTVVKLTSCGVPLLDASAEAPARRSVQPGLPVGASSPAVGDASGGRLHRQEEIARATQELCDAARSLGNGAGDAWRRAQHTMQVSSQLCSDAQQIRSHRVPADHAA